MTKSIISDKKECYICKSTNNLHLHHIMFGKNRKKADIDGLAVYLCYCHHESENGVHGRLGHELDIFLKKLAEEKWLEHYNKTIDDFISRYGRNYL